MGDDGRATFEELVYNKYFISLIGRNPDAGSQWAFRLDEKCMTMRELMERDEDGEYVREDISAMWYGWCLRHNQG
jgi:hypothetical protein